MTTRTDPMDRVLAEVLERLDRLEHENAVLRARLDVHPPDPCPTGLPSPPRDASGEGGIDVRPAVSRRGLLLGAGAVAAGAAGALAASSPAAAADGQNVVIGQANTATTNTTGLTASFNDRAVLQTTNNGTATAIYGKIQTATGQVVSAAVLGDSQGYTGVAGISTTNTGVYGRRGDASSSASPAAVVGDVAVGNAVAGYSASGTGVKGQRGVGTGLAGDAAVVGDAASGIGVAGHSSTMAVRGQLTDAFAITEDCAVFGNAGQSPGVVGYSAFKTGVKGVAFSGPAFPLAIPTIAGVFGEGQGTSTGVTGWSTNHTGVVGVGGNASSFGYPSGLDRAGVRGDSAGFPGVLATSTSGPGLHARSAERPAVEAVGSQSQLLLGLTGSRPSPVGESGHVAGEVVRDSNGNFWACVADGTWRKLAGPTSAGAFHVLPAPVHVYDSRPFTSPNVGSKTPLTANTPRTIDLTAASSGVPAGATAAVVNILVLNASAGNGNFTIWANGVSKPVATTMVWGGAAGGRYCSLAVTALDSTGKCQVQASIKVDVAIDVVGYYR